MERGEVAFFSDDRGYGFIRRKGWPEVPDIYFHRTAIYRPRSNEPASPHKRTEPARVQKGQMVECDLIVGSRGPYASEVKVIT